MFHIVFEYKDEFCIDGKFHKQECYVSSVDECIRIYGLDQCEYKIISVERVN